MDPQRTVVPPRIADALLRRALARDVRGLSTLGDLREEFHAIADPRAARWWYRLQAAAFAWRAARAAITHPRRHTMIFDLRRDVMTALRSFKRAPAITSLIVLTLAVAAGTTTIGFSFLDLVVLRMPAAEPGRAFFLMGIDQRRGDDRSLVSLPDFLDYRDRLSQVQHLAAMERGRATLVERGMAAKIDIVRASPSMFAVMGARPVLGRAFEPGEDAAGARPVALVAHHYWRDLYGSDPAILGRVVEIDRRPHEIIGVVSPDVEFGSLATLDFWTPLGVDRSRPRGERTLRVLGLHHPDTTLEQVDAQARTVASALALEHPGSNADWSARAVSMREGGIGVNAAVVIGLFAISIVLVMAVACANVAGLVLIRGGARRRELAIRAALGAARPRIVRQLVVEGLMLAGVAAALAVPVAEAGLRAIRTANAGPEFQQLTIDSHEVLFVAALAAFAPLLFSLWPALIATRFDLRGALAAGSVRAGAASGRLRGTLVVAQLAFAIILLTASGLSLRSGLNLKNVETGVDGEDVLHFNVDLDEGTFPDAATAASFVRAIETRLRALSRVKSVGTFDDVPMLGGERVAALTVPGFTPRDAASGPWALVNRSSMRSLETMGVPLVAGRWATASEDLDTRVAVISQRTADDYFGGAQSAIGRRLTMALGNAKMDVEVIGVAGNVRTRDLEEGFPSRVWLPLGAPRQASFAIEVASATPADLVADVRAAVRSVSPLIVVEGLEPFATTLARAYTGDLVLIAVFSAFAVLALVLASVGLYALVSHSAAQRMAEFSTRVALGAQTTDVIRLVIGQAFRLLGAGLAVGLAGGLLVANAMQALLYGVTPFDPLNLAGIVGLLTLVTIVASVQPALRAARVSLVDALRAE